MKWQPIDTAPRDGTSILLWATPHQMGIAKNRPIVGHFSLGWWSDFNAVISHASHWVPLPNPPENG